MNHTSTEDHGPSLPLAQSEVGSVSVCGCGVVTVTLHYISLRFEPAAFRELQAMLSHAQRLLEANTETSTPPAQRRPRIDPRRSQPRQTASRALSPAPPCAKGASGTD